MAELEADKEFFGKLLFALHNVKFGIVIVFMIWFYSQLLLFLGSLQQARGIAKSGGEVLLLKSFLYLNYSISIEFGAKNLRLRQYPNRVAATLGRHC
ncbi:MAG: hypothetical protein RMJ53_10905 [Chitinophagales bacterium]|nr:hypothetical protein [Chitinophagales bacterium]